MGREFLGYVLSSYGRKAGDGTGKGQRIRRHWEFRELRGLDHCLRVEDTVELEDAIAKIRNGPILCPCTRT